MQIDPSFFQDKKVFVTGHTGFKGTWLCHILTSYGAKVTGYSLQPPTVPSLFNISGISERITSVIGDLRDYPKLIEEFSIASPDVVFHLAAQPIVRKGYAEPAYTYETNVMGTVNILECVRLTNTVKSFVNITTDKVYKNNEWEWGYREIDELDGFDPYSNSKSCSELITHSYKRSFFNERSTAISTCRAGNVIGGGDFAEDRIIPDCVRSIISGSTIEIRNPNSTRPYQHVLEPLFGYLLIAQMQSADKKYSGSYNIGPEDKDCIPTSELVEMFCKEWGDGLHWKSLTQGGPHEATFLKLDCSKMKHVFNWAPKWNISETVKKTCEWTRAWLNNEPVSEIMRKQIQEYTKG